LATLDTKERTKYFPLDTVKEKTMPADRLDEFVEMLCQLPAEAWNATVTEGAGWKWMKPFSNQWVFGHFAALFTMLGLNDYQTKRGKRGTLLTIMTSPLTYDSMISILLR
jgi:hypothetical protein